MPIQKSGNHPANAGLFRSKTVKNGDKEQHTLLAKRIAEPLFRLIFQFDRIHSAMEKRMREQAPFPYSTQAFHQKMSNLR